jgi:nitrous oxide reductase accessory protein NosL
MRSVHRVLVIAAAAVAAAGCSGSRHQARPPEDVEAVLRAAHLQPHRVTLELRAANGAAPQPSVAPFDAAVQQSSPDMLTPLATLYVEQPATTVTVFATADEARQYSALMGGRATRFRAVVAQPLYGALSPRVRAALSHLR